MPFTFYFGSIMIYLGLTIVSIYAFRNAEVWANRGIRRA
jgi:ABC-type arginine transport system permease subunit